ncbi:MAG TPA: Uma2 family endonuclease [Gemmatimonadales bacterium]
MSLPPITTAEALYAHPDHERFELVRGALRVAEPPGGVHGRLATRLAYLLHAHVERHRLGTVLVEAGYVLARGPDTVRGPDISYVSKARIPPEQIPEAFIPGTPDLAVEIVSPDDRAREVAEQVADYLAAGAHVVWVVDPRHHCVEVHCTGRPVVRLGADDWLDGEAVVPGFRCEVAEVFGRT